MNPNRYRITFTILGLALAGVVLGAVFFVPSGTVTTLPDAVERISPADGTTVLRQSRVEIDMKVDYSVVLIVDGITIPDDEVAFNDTTGLYRWAPGPGLTIEDWTPGFHSVAIRWDRISGLPDPGELRWTFRIQ